MSKIQKLVLVAEVTELKMKFRILGGTLLKQWWMRVKLPMVWVPPLNCQIVIVVVMVVVTIVV